MSGYLSKLALICTMVSWPVMAEDLDEIVVTATKREEILLDIPISIVAVAGNSLAESVTRDLQDLAVSIPNVSIGHGLTTDSIHIRGVGSGNERSFEQSVGLFIDDVYMPRSRQYRAPVLDLDRVEFVRGPQSVLFGINATAGAISIHTSRSGPGDEFTAKFSAAYEVDYGGTEATTVIGGSPLENVGARVAASVLDTGKGYWENLASGEHESRLKDRQLRISIVFEPSDAVAIDAKVEHASFERNGGADELYTDTGSFSDGSDELNWVRGQDANLLPLFPSAEQPGFNGELLNFVASADVAVGGGGTISGIAATSKFDWSIYVDLDSSALTIADAGIVESYEQSSIELRYSSPDYRKTRFLVGASYTTSELGQNQPNLVDGNILLAPAGFPVPGFDAGRLWAHGMFLQDERLVSTYGMLTWNISDTVLIRGGVRYIKSEKDHLRSSECLVRRSGGSYDEPNPDANPNDQLLLQINFCPTPVSPARQTRSGNHLLPELSVQWSPNDSTMLYAKLSSSAKSGGFVAARIVIPDYFEYDDESGLGYEFGFKSSFADGRGDLSVALFHSEYDDLQINSFDPDTAAAIILNAGEVRTRGVELESRIGISDSVAVGAMVGILDAEYTRFDAGPCYAGETVNPDGITCNKNGMSLPNAPEVSGNVFLDVDAPLGERFGIFGRLNLDFSSRYLTNATLDPLAKQPAYTRLGAHLGLRNADGRWTVSLIGKNLTNESINNYTEAFLGVYRGYIHRPRTVWLKAEFNFGG